MKTHNTDGVHQIDSTRGRKNTNKATGRGIRIIDARGVDVEPVTTLHVGWVHDLDEDAAQIMGETLHASQLLTAITFPIIAHRGDMNPVDGYPENTIEAVRQAMTKGAHGVEFDVQRSSDGTWHLMHDSGGTGLNRTTDLTGAVSSKTDAQLAAGVVDAGFGWQSGTFDIPTADQVLNVLLPYNPIIYWDLKESTDEAHEALAEFIVARGMVPRSILLGLTLTGCEAAAAVAPTLDIQLPAVIDDDPQNYSYIDRMLAEHSVVVNAAYVQAREPKPVDTYISAETDYGIDETTIFTNMFARGVRAYMTNDLPNALLLHNSIVQGIESLTQAEVEDLIETTGHWEVVVSGTAPPVAVSTPADDDWVYAWVSG